MTCLLPVSLSACIKAKWSHSRVFLYISHCAQNTKSRVTRNNFRKGKFQNGKDLCSPFSLDITPPNQHWHPNNTVICVCVWDKCACSTHCLHVKQWVSFGLWGVEINQTGSQLGWFPVMKMNHDIIHVVKTETWKTQAAPWKSRDAFSFENRTMQSFPENESLSKRKDVNMKSS